MHRSAEPAKFIPALRFPWLTHFYDTLIRSTLKEEAIKERLIAQARIEAGQTVLDLGCGTGTLTMMLKRHQPDANIVGLDADPEILAIARKKAEAAGMSVGFQQGLASKPPFEEGSFDRIVSSLLFHHLTTDDKRSALAAARRMLRRVGELHIADWGKPHNAAMRIAFLSVQLLDGFTTTRDSVKGRLPSLLEEAGFVSVAETHREMTGFGTISLCRGVSP